MYKINENTVSFDLYGHTCTFDKIPYALWQLSEAFELKIQEDLEKLRENQKNGKPLKVTNEGYTPEGEKTSYQVLPWAWSNIDEVEEIIKNIGTFVARQLAPYGISLRPNWATICAPFLGKSSAYVIF